MHRHICECDLTMTLLGGSCPLLRVSRRLVKIVVSY
jgi:hypothetical protein